MTVPSPANRHGITSISRPIPLLDFTTGPRYHFERVPDAWRIGDSFRSELAAALYPIDREVLDEGADDAFAFFHGAVFEEVAGVGEAFEDGIDEGIRVRSFGRDLFELAETDLDLLTLGQEAAEAALYELAVLGRCSGHHVDHRIDLRREFLQAHLEAVLLRPRVE